ncbi:MAG: discoidin domain-containing protein [Eubacteriales bacterium]
MKKTLVGLLVSAMLLTIPAAASFADGASGPEDWAADCSAESGNLAYGKDVYYHWSRAHGQGWEEEKKDRHLLTDASFDLFYSNGDAYHTNRGNNWAAIDFGEKTEFDTVVLYPAKGESEYCHGFPNAIRLLVTDNVSQFENCTDWYNCSASGLDYAEGDVIAEYYDLGSQPFEPVTFQFPAVSGRVLVVQGLSLNFEWCEMQLSEIAVYNEGYTAPEERTNLALGKTVTSDSYYEDDGNNWHLTNINNGNRYDMNTLMRNEGDYGQFCGYHSNPSTIADGAADIYICFDMGEATAVDEMVIVPSSTKYKYGGSATEMNMPANFKIQMSDDGENWTTVLSETGYEWGEYRPHSFTFDSTEGRYIRLLMEGITDHVKISEIELYSSAAPATEPDPTEPDPTEPDPVLPEPPKTGSAVGALAVLCIVSAAGIAVIGKKRDR